MEPTKKLIERRDALRQAPEPVQADTATVLAIGTALWALAFLVLLPFADRLEAAGHGRWLPICATGVVLGILGWLYCRFRGTP